MTNQKYFLALAAFGLGSSLFAGDANVIQKKSASENDWDAHRVDSHAPIGVMGDHTHEVGEFMFSYRFSHMDMGTNFLGNNEVANDQIISPTGGGYLVTPTDMEMDMHMIGLMAGVTDQLTALLMIPFVDKSMDHVRRDGVEFNTQSSGISDLKFGGMFKFYDANNQRLHLNLSVAAPTGSIEEAHFVPGLGRTRLPYAMQNGWGTWNLEPGVTYLGQSGNFSWGAQFLAYLPLDENDEGYAWGNRFRGTVWSAYQLSEGVSASVRVAGTSQENIDGADRDLRTPASVVPLADPTLRGGDRIDVFGGLNFYLKNGHRFAIEAGAPVYQNLDGPQLGTDWMITAGWQKSF